VEKVRLAIVNDSLNMLDLIVGMELGFYERAGVLVEAVPVAGRRAVASLLKGEVDVAVQVGPALRAFAEGERELRLVLMIHVNPPHWMMARPGAGGVEGLRGKKVWIGSKGSDIGFLIQRWLEKLGLNPERDVALLYHPFEPFWIRALIRMAADVVMVVPPEKEIVEKEGYTPLVEITEVFPNCLTHGFVTTRKNLEQRAGILRGLMMAQTHIARFMRLSGDEVVHFIQERWRIDGDHARACYNLLQGRMFADRPGPYLDGPLSLVPGSKTGAREGILEFAEDPLAGQLVEGLELVPPAGSS